MSNPFSVYAKAVWKHWGTKVSGRVLAIIGLVLLVLSIVISNPYALAVCTKWGSWVTLTAAGWLLLVAMYDSWKDQYEPLVALQGKLLGFPRITPCADAIEVLPFVVNMKRISQSSLEPSKAELVHTVIAGFSALRIRLINDPLLPTADSVAHGVSAHLIFLNANGQRRCEMDGRWADSPQHAERDKAKDFVANILAVSFNVGQARTLDIAFKHIDEYDCFALNNDNFAEGVSEPRLPHRKLNRGLNVAKIRVRAVHVDLEIEVKFNNPGAGQPLEIIGAEHKNNFP